MFAFPQKFTLISHTLKRNKVVFVPSTIHLDDNAGSEIGELEITLSYDKTKGGVVGVEVE